MPGQFCTAATDFCTFVAFSKKGVLSAVKLWHEQSGPSYLQMPFQEDGAGGLTHAQIRAVSATGVVSFIHVTSQDVADAAKGSGGGRKRSGR